MIDWFLVGIGSVMWDWGLGVWCGYLGGMI